MANQNGALLTFTFKDPVLRRWYRKPDGVTNTECNLQFANPIFKRRLDRSRLLGLRRLLRDLLAMGPVFGPVGLRLLLNENNARRFPPLWFIEESAINGRLGPFPR